MRNPFRSESGSLRFVVVVVGAAAIIVLAAWINTWLGVAAAAVAVAGIVWWLLQEPVPGAAGPPRRLESRTPAGTRRVLVVAAPGTASVPTPEASEIVVIVPALASKLEAVTGDVDDRRADAEQTALTLTRQLSREGASVRGEVGADDPVLAVEDALRQFGADEIVVAGGSHDTVEHIRERVTVPVSLV